MKDRSPLEGRAVEGLAAGAVTELAIQWGISVNCVGDPAAVALSGVV